MEKPVHSDEEYKLWVLFLRVRDMAFKARQRELSRHNISPRQSAILFAIKDAGRNATPGEIARRSFREPHSVSEILSRMEKDGLIKKNKVQGGGNRVTVTLTKKGQNAFRLSAKRDSIHRMISALSKEERRQLKASLMILWESALKELESKPETFFPFD
jgi:DNA-binding MarR family transcriptional regulator